MHNYRVWIKGQTETTICGIEANSKLDAQIRFAGRMGCKSYQVEAIRD